VIRHCPGPSTASRLICKSFSMNPVVRNKAGLSLLLLLIGICFFIFWDFGLSWDESAQRDLGEVTYNYIFHSCNKYEEYHDRDYGVAFEFPLIVLEKTLKLKDTRTVYLLRHVITHLFFLLAAFYFYLLVKLLFDNEWLAILGFLLLVLHPRIYGHSFFNTKDIPFLSMMIISFYYGALAFRNKDIRNTVLFGIATGVTINIRIMGILLFAVVVLIYSIDFIFHLKNGRRREVLLGAVFCLCTISTLLITWPYLWKDPLQNFIQAFINMSHFRWEGVVLYIGHMIKATETPWHYPLVWLLITTPMVFLFIILVGTYILARDCFKNPLAFFFHDWQKRLLFLCTACSYGSLTAVIILHSVLYDGWRQLFFIYPGLLIIGLYGIHRLVKRYEMSKQLTFPILIILVTLSSVPSMILIHPFQHVFFNDLVPKKEQYLRETFEMDYWGTSYMTALKTILSNDARSSISIAVANYPGVLNSLILPTEQRKRIRYVEELESADYFISNYRFHPQDYEYRNVSSRHEWHSIEIYNSKIISIFKLKKR